MKTISAQVIVKNEARFVWYSIMSVIRHVDKVFVLDTGSTDGTIEIVQSIEKSFPNKVSFEKESQDIFDEEATRQRMLDKVTTDWFLVLDADEIWWKESITKVIETLNTKEVIECIVTPTINAVGDMYHYQEERAGNYTLAGKVGHYNIRAISRNILGLHSFGKHGVWGWVDNENKMIQDRTKESITFIDAPYLHATYLQRAGTQLHDMHVYKRKQKRRHEIGMLFPKDYFYPESFFFERPTIVPSVWEAMDRSFFVRSQFETPARKIKRRILPRKVGY